MEQTIISKFMSDLIMHNGSGARICDAGFVQRREWMLHKIRPDKAPFNVLLSFTFTSFDLVKAQKSIDLMIGRHEILRTTLTVIEGDLKQVIHLPQHFPVTITSFEIENLPEEERIRFERSKVAEKMKASFDFESGPLFRVLLFKQADNCFNFHFIFHHVIIDQYSLKIFTREITDIYTMLLHHTVVELPQNSYQYAAYARFENDLLNTTKGDKYIKYWQSALADGVPGLHVVDKEKLHTYQLNVLRKVTEVKEKMAGLPWYDERFLATLARRYRLEAAGEIKYIYPGRIFNSIKLHLEKSRNSLLSLLIASLLQAFNNLNAQKVFTFEIMGSRRSLPEFEETIGWLSTSGPCFFNIADHTTSEQLLDHIDEQLYFLSRHCVYPFEAAVPGFMPPIGSSFPVFLSLSQWKHDSGIKETGVILKKEKGAAAYQDITFFFDFFNDTAALHLTYNNFLFTAELVDALVNGHVNFLEQIIDNCSNL